MRGPYQENHTQISYKNEHMLQPNEHILRPEPAQCAGHVGALIYLVSPRTFETSGAELSQTKHDG